tara:strand:- start:1089 stop:1688 length:600 start_codon:yes stop_codon:yes gene_type:complete
MSSLEVQDLLSSWNVATDGVARHGLGGSAMLQLTFPGRLTTMEASSLLGIDPEQYDMLLLPKLEAVLEREAAAVQRIDTQWLSAARAVRSAPETLAPAGMPARCDVAMKPPRPTFRLGARCFVLYPEQCTDGCFHYFPARITKVRDQEPRYSVAWKDGDVCYRDVLSCMVAKTRQTPRPGANAVQEASAAVGLLMLART